jgi:hypothetical protein
MARWRHHALVAGPLACSCVCLKNYRLMTLPDTCLASNSEERKCQGARVRVSELVQYLSNVGRRDPAPRGRSVGSEAAGRPGRLDFTLEGNSATRCNAV